MKKAFNLRIAEGNHVEFDTKKEALAYLDKNALKSVGWTENGKKKVAIYWNGKLHIENADTKKVWGKTAFDLSEAMLTDLEGGWSFSPKYHGTSFIITKDGIFVRGPYSSENYRQVYWRHAFMELRLNNAPQEVQDAFNYSRGSLSALIGELEHTKAFFTKKITTSRTAQHLENVKTLETLTERELTRALRDAIISEEGAIKQYETIADSIDDKEIKKQLQSLSDEEKVHVGELQTMLNEILPDEQKLMDEGAKEVEDDGNKKESNMNIANELLIVAKSLVADYPFAVRDTNFYDVVRDFKRGGWEYAEVFPGKTHRVVGKSMGKSAKIPASYDIEGAMLQVKIQEITYAEATPDMLVLEFVGSKGRTDTYVFTKVPYNDLMAGKITPRVVAPRTTEFRDQVIQKLYDKGLHNLGERMAKAGEQFGKVGQARRLGVGKTYLMANYLVVDDNSTPQRRLQGSRWNMNKQWLLREVDDRLIDELISWINRGPTMIEVRQWAYDKHMSDPNGGGYASGLQRKEVAASQLQDDDTAKDIATDVATRIEKGLTIGDAFDAIGYWQLYRKTRENDMPDNFDTLPTSGKVKELTKAIEKALKR